MDQILNFKHNKSDEDFYQILGCDEKSSLEQISCEYRIRALSLHPDKHEDKTEELSEKFRKLQKAKNILTDSEKRKSYDRWRTSGIAMSYENWSKLGKDVHNSMHWIKRSDNNLMIEPNSSTVLNTFEKKDSPKSQKVWKRESGDEMLRKFRNYEI